MARATGWSTASPRSARPARALRSFTFSNNASGGFVKSLGRTRGVIVTQVFPLQALAGRADREGARLRRVRGLEGVTPRHAGRLCRRQVLVIALKRAGASPSP